MHLPQELRDQGTVIDLTWRDAGRRAGGAGQEEQGRGRSTMKSS